MPACSASFKVSNSSCRLSLLFKWSVTNRAFNLATSPL
jgi:hypothetical protein